MRYIFILIYALYTPWATAQHITEPTDTIIIKGKVVDFNNTPMPNVSIYSKKGISHPQTSTDDNGEFILYNAAYNDSLTIEYLPNYSTAITNSGSRFLSIMLPFRYKDNDTIEITAQKLKNKIQKNKKACSPKEEDIVFECTYPIYFIWVPAEFPWGAPYLKKVILSKLKYPEEAIKNNIEGMVKIGFTINTDGKLTDFQTLQGIGYGCEEEVLRVLKELPSWNPAINKSKASISKETISIEFKLTD